MLEFHPGIRIAFDVGTVRIGVAVCDKAGILASPLSTLQREPESDLVKNLQELFFDNDPLEVFVGLPRSLSNTDTKSTRDALGFARLLSDLFTIPVLMVDERLSTVSATNDLRQAGRNSKSMRSIIDQQAACVILETALSLERNGRQAGVLIDEY